MGELFPALDMKQTKDKLSVQFYQSIIAALDTPQHLIIKTANDIHSILSAVGVSLRTVKSIVLQHKDDTNGALDCCKLVPWQNSSEMNVIVEGIMEEVVRKVLWHCCKLDIQPAVFIFAESHSCKKLDISSVLREDISKLYLMSEQGSLGLVSRNSDELFCPVLTEVHLVNTKIHKTILSSLNEVVDKGFMETLTCMSFISCKGLMGKLHLLFHSTRFPLTHLDLRYTKLNDDDLHVLSACNKSGKLQLTTLALSQCPEKLKLDPLFENVWKHLTSFS